MTVPLAAPGQGQRFNYENRDTKASFDLTSDTLNILAYAPGAIGGNLHVFFTTTDPLNSSTSDVALASLTGGFQTVSIPVPTARPPYDPAKLLLVRIEVEAGSAFGTNWRTPATVVYEALGAYRLHEPFRMWSAVRTVRRNWYTLAKKPM